MKVYYTQPPQSWVVNFPQTTCLGAGPTVGRPVHPPEGSYYDDTTLGIPVWWINGEWVNGMGAPS